MTATLPPDMPLDVFAALAPAEKDVYRMAFGSALAEGQSSSDAAWAAGGAVQVLHSLEDVEKAFYGKRKQKLQTLYVHRPLLNTDAVRAWAKEQGFKSTLPDMHVTLAYSKEPVDWNALEAKEGELTVARGKKRAIERFDGGAVVLRLESSELQRRWQELCDAGADWKYDDYKPHVTITYEGEDVDLEAVEPYDGPLIFGPEEFSEIEEDGFDPDDVEEVTLKRVYGKYNPYHDERGRFAEGPGGGGEFSPRNIASITGSEGAEGGGGGGVARAALVVNGKAGAHKRAVEEALGGIPPEHAALVAHIPINVVDVIRGDDGNTLGLFTFTGTRALHITLGQAIEHSWTTPDGKQHVFKTKTKDPGGVAVHEVGHAVDHWRGWGHSMHMRAEFMREVSGMTSGEARKARYYLNDPREMFAEMYRMAHGPVPKTKSVRVFGGMEYGRAQKVFAKSIAAVKGLKP